MSLPLDPRIHRWLLTLGIMGVVLMQLMIIANTSTTVVYWDSPDGGGSKILDTAILVPFWVYPLQCLSAITFILGLVLYIKYWYLTRV